MRTHPSRRLTLQVVLLVALGGVAAVAPPAGLATPLADVLFDVPTLAAVDNDPTRATTFALTAPTVITCIRTYHWNAGQGSSPGTIALQDQTGTVHGPWQAAGEPGQGGVPDAYWVVRPEVELPAGTYTVLDSTPSTWARNNETGGRGIATVLGRSARAPVDIASPSGPDHTGPVEAPVITAGRAAPTVIDVPFESRSLTVSPDREGQVAMDGMVMSVPAGAVSRRTTIEVKKLTAPFHMKNGPPPVPSGQPGDVRAARCAGPIFDLGPDGLEFDRPVTITLPYDEAALPAGFPEEKVAFAYWNGEAWVACPGQVDTAANTVTVRLNRFDGLIQTTLVGVIVVGAVIVGTGVYIYDKLTDPERISSDPLTLGTAKEWITPEDPHVRAWSERGQFTNKSGVAAGLDDPSALGRFIDDAEQAGDRPFLSFVHGNADGSDSDLRGRYTRGDASNWRKPRDYLTTGDRRGDCTDISCAVTSMLIHRGYRAKVVFGYSGDKQSPHVWVELVIDGKPYFIDENGGINSLTAAQIKNAQLIHPDPDDPRGFMFDHTGQQRYDPRWYEQGPAGPPRFARVYWHASGLGRVVNQNSEGEVRERATDVVESGGAPSVQIPVALHGTRISGSRKWTTDAGRQTSEVSLTGTLNSDLTRFEELRISGRQKYSKPLDHDLSRSRGAEAEWEIAVARLSALKRLSEGKNRRSTGFTLRDSRKLDPETALTTLSFHKRYYTEGHGSGETTLMRAGATKVDLGVWLDPEPRQK